MFRLWPLVNNDTNLRGAQLLSSRAEDWPGFLSYRAENASSLKSGNPSESVFYGVWQKIGLGPLRTRFGHPC